MEAIEANMQVADEQLQFLCRFTIWQDISVGIALNFAQ